MKKVMTKAEERKRILEVFRTIDLLKKEEEKRKQEEMFRQLDYEYEKELEREELEAFYYGNNVPPKKKINIY